MANAERAVPARGPVHPTASAAVAHRPLASTGADGTSADEGCMPGGTTSAAGSGVRLTSGLLHDWQQRNRAASLPLALRQLQAAGNLDNLRLAIAGTGEGYRGPAFMDSDIYKTLEAIGWELGHAADPGLAAFAAEVTSLLAKAQQADGYLNSCIQASGARRYARLASSHELYCAGHLIQAAVAASRTFDDGPAGGGPALRRSPGGRLPRPGSRAGRSPDRRDGPGGAIPADRRRPAISSWPRSSSTSAATA